ncbi:beta-ketoacyl synthase N-terminal-like domain-containing protein [Amycolatopsis sp. cmx-11-51]|uniref:beta-ketoacyl synthase N-terminal-like domain-containing protein n=1 Tax=unclassified Amycolatopsis TaxID=2618356 RepID=UPI0039E5B3A4
MTPGAVAITDWSVVSPYGLGNDAFAEGIHTARGTVTRLDLDHWQSAEDRACLVPGFDVREVLGHRGTRTMDRLTGLAVAAIGELLARTGVDNDDARLAATGLVLGTAIGSAQSTMDFIRPSYTADVPYFVDPAQMPNAAMNGVAARSAIWHRLKGPNATVAGGQAAGLHALGYARRLLRSGHVTDVVCGGAEEYSTARSWLDHRSRGGERATAVPGEGCAVLMLTAAENTGGSAQAELLAVHNSVCLDSDFRQSVRACLLDLLGRAGASPADVWAAASSGDSPGAGTAEQDVMVEVFGSEATERVAVTELVGDTGCASAGFQIAAILAAAAEDEAAIGKLAIVSSSDRDGTVAGALLRLRGPAC